MKEMAVGEGVSPELNGPCADEEPDVGRETNRELWDS